MTLAEDFRFPELLSKGSRPIDRDADGKVYDGTKRERPAMPGEQLPGGAARRGLGGAGRRPKGAQPRGSQKVKAPQKQPQYLVHWEDQGVKRDKLFPDKEDALDFARARNRGGAKNVGAYPEGHPKYKEAEGVANQSRIPRKDMADGNIEDVKGMPGPGQLPDGGRKKRDMVVEPGFDPKRGMRMGAPKKDEGPQFNPDQPNDPMYVPKGEVPDDGQRIQAELLGIKAGMKGHAGPPKGIHEDLQLAWRNGHFKGHERRQQQEAKAPEPKKRAARPKMGDAPPGGWKDKDKVPGATAELERKRKANEDKKAKELADKKKAADGAIDRINADNKDWRDKFNADNKDWRDKFNYDNLDDGAFWDHADKRLKAVPDAKETDALRAEGKKRGIDIFGSKRPVGTPDSEGMVTNSRGEREDVGNRAERKMVEGEMRAENNNGKPHFVRYADGRGVVAFPNRVDAEDAAARENRAIFQAANGRRGGAGRNGRFDNAQANAARVIGPDHEDYEKLKADEGGGAPSKPDPEFAAWKDVPVPQRYINGQGERMVQKPEGLVPWKGPEGHGRDMKAQAQGAPIDALDSGLPKKPKVAREAADGGVGRRIGGNPDANVARRMVFDARGLRDVDTAGNTIPPKTPEPVKAKLQIRADKRRGGYNVVGIDYKGRKVKVHVKNREVGQQMKAALARREIGPDDFLDEWELADKQRRLRDDKAERDAKQAVQTGDKPSMPDGYVGFDPKKRGANNTENPKDEPHLAMYFDDKGKHIRNFANQREALEFMFMRNAKGEGHKDDAILGPKDKLYTMNAAMGYGPDGMPDRIANSAMIRLAEKDAADRELRAKELAAKKKLAEAAPATPAGTPKYRPDDPYQMGDVVEFDGHKYRALKNFAAGGPSPRVKGMWERIDDAPKADAPKAGAKLEPIDKAKLERFNRYAEDIIDAIGPDQGQIAIGGDDAGNDAARQWIRVQQAALGENRNEYIKQLDKYLGMEDKLPNGATDIQDAVDDLMEQVDEDLLDRVVAQVEEWGRELGDADVLKPKNRRANIGNGAGKPARPARPASDEPPKKYGNGYNAAAIAAHFEAGGGIADAPIGDVREYILAHPERFTVALNGKKGVSPNVWVIDNSRDTGIDVTIPFGKENGYGIDWKTTRGEVWVMKGSAIDFRGGMKDDVLNEIMGQNLQEQLGIYAAGARWATPPDHVNEQGKRQPHVLQLHLAQASSSEDSSKKMLGFVPGDIVLARRGKGVEIDGWEEGSEWLDNLEDPGQLMELGVLDFLIQNHDRHPGNWSGMVMKDGKVRIGVYDNGYAFGAVEGHGFIQKADDFFARTNYAGANIRKGAKAFKDKRAARQRMMEIITKANEFDMDAALQRLRDGGVTASDYAEAKKQLEIMRRRIDDLYKNREAIVERWVG